MKIYYFKKAQSVVEGGIGNHFGNGRDDFYESPEELIEACADFLMLPKEEVAEKTVLCEEIPDYDFFAIQEEVDGFGNDTYTVAIFKTKEECAKYLKRKKNNKMKIVGQHWGEYRDGWE